MQKSGFVLPVRVYYEDTDAGGVVYHSQYLNFMERARTEWLRELGFSQELLVRELNVLFVVRHVGLDYLRPARLDDRLEVHSQIAQVARTSVEFSQDIWRLAEPGNTEPAGCLTRATVKVVCIDADRFKPVALPPLIKDRLSGEY
ncbi:MAG: tol-pal system-associated acyl-CoA thioesterase [Thiolinea sp.]